MPAKILQFTGFTKLDLDPDTVLEAAQGHLVDVVLVGRAKNGELYVAASQTDLGQVLLRIEAAKKMLIENFLEG